MSTDVPGGTGRRPRPPRPTASGSSGVQRPDRARSFRELLDEIPDIEREPTAKQAGATASGTRPAPGPPLDLRAQPPKERTADGAPTSAPAPARQELPPATPAPATAPDGPPWWRRVGVVAVSLLLVAAIPFLGREGYRLIVRSTDGREVTRERDPNAPNYEEVVDSTPTVVLVQAGADGSLDALTFVSLNSERGGTVLYVPGATLLAAGEDGRRTLEHAYEQELPNIDRAQQEVAREVGLRLNVGIDEVVAVDDRSIAQLVEPVGTISIDNPDRVLLEDGTVLESGPVRLTPDQVGPYLGYRGEGEDQLSQFARHELVWRAWLNAIAASGDDEIVPGPTDEGISPILRTLASGSVNYTALPGNYGMVGGFVPDEAAIRAAMVDAVPVPDAPEPGARVIVRLLNGAEPGGPTNEQIRKVVAANGSVTIIGNGPSFDRPTTEAIIPSEDQRQTAQLMLGVLGATQGTIRVDPSAPDNLDLTIIIGRDAAAGGS